MPNVQWRQFGDYSGPMVVGATAIPVPTSKLSAERFYWLTTKVETNGTFGTVVMFDGTGLTAGPDQFIIVYPKELANEDFNAEDDQGPLGALLARVLAVATTPAAAAIQAGFRARGWVLSPSGVLRYAADQTVTVAGKQLQVKAGATVHGALIRNELTPAGGRVPPNGPQWDQAARWATLFSQLFSDPATFTTQRLYGLEHMEKAFQSRRLNLNGISTVEQVIGADVTTATLTPALELAFAVWYSNSVNAPAIAVTCLQNAWKVASGSRELLPRVLLQMLGTSNFGRWNANIPGGRWQRTRDAAIRSGLWPWALFDGPNAIMPVRPAVANV